MLPAMLERFKERFERYARSFAGPDGSLCRAMECKLLHTREVCAVAASIASSEGLALEDRLLAEAVALFHDVARFEQYRDYGTFSDRKSFDHGEAGAKLLLREASLDGLPASEKEPLLKAVSLHNKPSLPPGLDSRTELFAKIVRDADKAAILSFFAEYFYDSAGYWKDPTIQLDAPDLPGFSADVAERALSGRLVMHSEIKCVNDFKLAMFAWVSDLNFPSSARAILESGLYEKLAATLPEDPLIEKLSEATKARLRSLTGAMAASEAIA